MIVLDESAINALEFGMAVAFAWVVILTAVGIVSWLGPIISRWYERMIDDDHTD